MVFRRFNEMELAERIEELPRPLRAAFAAACAERQLPAYHEFSAQSNRGDPRILEHILNRLWTDLSAEPVRGSFSSLCNASR